MTSSNLEQNCRLIIQTFAKTYLPIIFNGLVSDIRPTFFDIIALESFLAFGY